MIQIDMPMPSNCYDCWIRQNMGCRIANDSGWLNDRRDDNCPLKAQEPRLVTEADFENADPYGYLPVWVEDKNDTEIVCDCITKAALIDVDTGYAYRFWTSRPTDEQREKEPWNGQA